MNIKTRIDQICWIGFSIYIVLAAWWSPERLFNTDNSNYFFQIINFNNFYFPENRYGVWLSQIPLLVAMHFKLNFQALVFIYSLTFPVIYLLVGLLCRYYLQVKEAWLSILLSMVCGVAFSFFHFVTETHQCIVYALGFYAVVVAKRNNPLYFRIPLGLFFIAQSLLCHPNAAFILFALVLTMLLNKDISPMLVAAIVIVLVGFVAYKLNSATGYDQQQYNNLKQSLDKLSSLHRSHYFYFLKGHLVSTYLSFIILLFSIIIYAVQQNQLTKFLAICVYAICFTVITIITFYNGDSDSMMEKSLMPALLPFMVFASRNIFYNEKILTIKSMLLSIVLLVSFFTINKAKRTHTYRLTYLQSILEKNNYYPKLYVEKDSVINTPLFISQWATTIDAIWLSRMHGKPASTLYIKHADEGVQKYDCDTCILYVPWWSDISYSNLNHEYISFPKVIYKNAILPEK